MEEILAGVLAGNTTSAVSALAAAAAATAGGGANTTSAFAEAAARSMLRAALNDYFVGGLGLMLVGGAAALARDYWERLLAFCLRRRGVVSVRIKTSDMAYEWVQQWLAENASSETTELNLRTSYDDDCCEDDGGNDVYWDDAGRKRYKSKLPNLTLVPQLRNQQTVVFHGEKVHFQMGEPEAALSSGGGGGDLAALLRACSTDKSLQITAASASIIRDLLTEAMTQSIGAQRTVTTVWRWNSRNECWNKNASRRARPLESVVLEDGVADTLLADATRFLDNEAWYRDRGVPYRRGVLLHGPPGCGKSSLIVALAGALALDVSMASLSSKQMSDDMLHQLVNDCPLRSLIVFEDIDAAFRQRTAGEGAGGDQGQLSFSGLLNALDGVCAQEGRILIMTTNHPERLDPALVRPGRIDLRLKLDLASSSQVRRLYMRFFPTATEEDAEAMAAAVGDRSVSPAALQNHFMIWNADPAEALRLAPTLLGGQSARADNSADERGSGGADASGEAGPTAAAELLEGAGWGRADGDAEVAPAGEEEEEVERSAVLPSLRRRLVRRWAAGWPGSKTRAARVSAGRGDEGAGAAGGGSCEASASVGSPATSEGSGSPRGELVAEGQGTAGDGGALPWGRRQQALSAAILVPSAA